MSAAAPVAGGSFLLNVLGAVLLADCAWGLLWHWVSGDGQVNVVVPDVTGLGMPYSRPGAPLAQFVRWLHGFTNGTRWHDLMAALALTLGLSWILGGGAIILTLIAVVLIFLGRVLAGAFWAALLRVGLPWALGLSQAAAQDAGTVLSAQAWFPSAALGAAFVLLDWGLQRSRWRERLDLGAIVVTQGVLMAMLVVLKVPWVAALVAPLLLASLWSAARAAGNSELKDEVLRRISTWYWAAMMVSAVLLRQV